MLPVLREICLSTRNLEKQLQETYNKLEEAHNKIKYLTFRELERESLEQEKKVRLEKKMNAKSQPTRQRIYFE
jgi:hypothetical protein